MATSGCVHNQNGFCKYNNNCRYLHVNELCSNSNRSSKGCKLRHPRPCRYFNAFGACKFGHNCSYQHLTPIRDEIQLIKQEIFSLKTQLDNLAKCLENGLATLQNKEPPVTLQFPNNPHCLAPKLSQAHFQCWNPQFLKLFLYRIQQIQDISLVRF